MHLVIQRYAADLAFRNLSFLHFLQMLLLEVLAQVTRRAKGIDANAEWCALIAQAHETNRGLHSKEIQ